MKKYTLSIATCIIAVFTFSLVFVSCAKKTGVAGNIAPAAFQTDSIKKARVEQFRKMLDSQKTVREPELVHYNAVHYQEWSRNKDSHSENIKVIWPDGDETIGADKYHEKLKTEFNYAPDTRIHESPMRIGASNKTAITGILAGTFTQPMTVDGGKSIKPTGKSFSIPIYAIAIWENGLMVEEYLFWDKNVLLDQLGIRK